MDRYVMPDFKEWAENKLHELAMLIQNVEDPIDRMEVHTKLISEALEQSFNQGKALGDREGYERGIQDADGNS